MWPLIRVSVPEEIQQLPLVLNQNRLKRNAEFFDFYKSMQAYEASLGGDSTTMVLTPDSDFFRFFGQESID